jgi:hypothetical protein
MSAAEASTSVRHSGLPIATVVGMQEVYENAIAIALQSGQLAIEAGNRKLTIYRT